MHNTPVALKKRLIHRDLSWLFFNERVLTEAIDLRNPLLERIKFLAIFVNNLDEFFMVRVAGHKRLLESEFNRPDEFGYLPQDIYRRLIEKINLLEKELSYIYSQLRRELKKNSIVLASYEELNDEQKKYIQNYFESVIFPIVTPMAIDQGHPFPILPSKTLAFAISLKKNTNPGFHFAILPIPHSINRLIKVPVEDDCLCFVRLEDVIRHNLGIFFRGHLLQEQAFFRVLRDSELDLSEEFTPHLLKAIEAEIKKRPHARVIRLEIEKGCSQDLRETICRSINFRQEEVAVLDRELDLTYLFKVATAVNRADLLYPALVQARVAYENIFDKIKEGDLLLHVPYQHFQPTIDLLATAASDPDVLGIKMTLYRANNDSAIITALKTAAKNNKQVTVLVEIKARFDEEKNILWARELEEAGCHVIYGIPGLKIHSKITMIIRREEDHIKRYVHLSTGNYNENTARVYTDLGYFTVNDDFARDISDIFNVITGYSLPDQWKRVVSSPQNLRNFFFKMIEAEIKNQQEHKNGFIYAKLNSLEDIQIIEKLYEASCAGVKINLLVRGICCLKPGQKKLSENIQVRSIVGRFLEHSRIYIFNNNSDQRVFLSSADWMRRNLDKRIELLFEIYKAEHKEHLRFIMDKYWQDTAKAREFDGTDYVKRSTDGKFNTQEYFLGYY